MRYRVVAFTGSDSPRFSDKECIADFRYEDDAKKFCKCIGTEAYVIDCFDDTIIFTNRK